MKFTRSLLLLKNGDEINVYQKGQKILILKKNWDLDRILTEIHSNGFYNIDENKYYDIPV